MKEREIKTTIEHQPCSNGAWIDWPVVIYYEYDGGIQINGVYDDNEMGDTDHWNSGLTREQVRQVECACIDDYADLCDYAEAMAEDLAASRSEAEMDRRKEIAREMQHETLRETARQSGVKL